MPSVLVTGAGRGIGRATTGRLAEHGWEVIAGVRRAEEGEELVGAQPGRVTSVVLDITDEQQLAGLDAALPAKLDAVVNNAGVVVGGPIEALPLSGLRRQLEVNVVGQATPTTSSVMRWPRSRWSTESSTPSTWPDSARRSPDRSGWQHPSTRWPRRSRKR